LQLLLSVSQTINNVKTKVMHREIHQWVSPRLNKNMEIAMYGHHGFALLLLPTAAADYLEY
jgi:esterase/lipase superfamily enzyme